jgi:hypothetical protein
VLSRASVSIWQRRGCKITHPLFRRHGIEVATAAEGIAGPFGGPLRLLGLDGFFESPTIVAFPTEHDRVSMRAISLRVVLFGDWEMGIESGRKGRTNSTGFLRLRTRPSKAHSRPSTSADGGPSATPNSISCGPT